MSKNTSSEFEHQHGDIEENLCEHYEKEPSSVLIPEVPRVTVTRPVIQVSVGGDATLECQATGVPPPLVHWFKGQLRSTATQTHREVRLV